MVGNSGLGNSEVAVSAALSGAKWIGCEIMYLPLEAIFITKEIKAKMSRTGMSALWLLGVLLVWFWVSLGQLYPVLKL